jgi:DNA-binding LytR/AlgR family response regulator
MLIKMKLSTRLCIALAVYTALIGVILWRRNKQTEVSSQKKEYPSVIPVKSGKKSVIVNIDRISYIRSDGPYIALYTAEGKHLIDKRLKDLLEELDPTVFRRIHRSTVLNIREVAQLKSRQNGDYDVVLKDGSVLRLSRNYVKGVRGILL